MATYMLVYVLEQDIVSLLFFFTHVKETCEVWNILVSMMHICFEIYLWPQTGIGWGEYIGR